MAHLSVTLCVFSGSWIWISLMWAAGVRFVGTLSWLLRFTFAEQKDSRIRTEVEVSLVYVINRTHCHVIWRASSRVSLHVSRLAQTVHCSWFWLISTESTALLSPPDKTISIRNITMIERFLYKSSNLMRKLIRAPSCTYTVKVDFKCAV